jgi:uncharacterized protein YndB with AHSA1/START domain
MEQKTKVNAEDGQQQLVITRKFDLPADLVFKAYSEAELMEQWMGTKVLKLESKKHGSYQIETSDNKGNVAFRANGVIHEFIANEKITRTFEMENTPFGVQLEIYEFEQLTDDTCQLNVQVIFESVTHRDKMLKLPFAQGINMAHNRMQDILSKLK